MSHSKDLTSAKRDVLDGLFFGRPSENAVVAGSRQNIRSYLERHPLLIPDEVYPRSSEVLHELLLPGGGNILKGPPKIYGIQNLFPIIADLLRPEDVDGDHEIVQLNLALGLSTLVGYTKKLDTSPVLSSHVNLGLERLKGLLEVTTRVRLRIFSMGPLIATLTKTDPDIVRDIQSLQRGQIEALIAEFYPELIGHVSTEGVTTDIPIASRVKYKTMRYKVMRKLRPQCLNSMDRISKKYGTGKIEDVIRYAVYSCFPETFSDNSEEGKYQVSIVDQKEDPFMAIRGFDDTSYDQFRLGVVVRTLGSYS